MIMNELYSLRSQFGHVTRARIDQLLLLNPGLASDVLRAENSGSANERKRIYPGGYMLMAAEVGRHGRCAFV